MEGFRTIKASEIKMKKPEWWYFQSADEGDPFWDSFLHTHSGCKMIKKQKEYPFSPRKDQ
jgi:hypothetical protein